MSEIPEVTGPRDSAAAAVTESYSFACMRCGHGWEQSYEIEHHTDGDGNRLVLYVADDRVVPSPLSRPSCQNCDSRVVRIMRAGQVSSVQRHDPHRRRPQAGPVVAPAPPSAQDAVGRERHGRHHWHLSDLLHPFRRKAV
ncbi:hypothetical protein ABZ920_18225 [Streptomyces sp. NPDC046831]|uniref:hypothetical protein n=1 Tax=Streptomyces sp. NPDC046831 TaxID=3154805 RepID=UPI0033E52BC5